MTQLIWFGTTEQLQKLDFPLLSHRFPHFTFLSSVRDLGVSLDIDGSICEEIPPNPKEIDTKGFSTESSTSFYTFWHTKCLLYSDH